VVLSLFWNLKNFLVGKISFVLSNFLVGYNKKSMHVLKGSKFVLFLVFVIPGCLGIRTNI
jgi:hypothetical protein